MELKIYGTRPCPVVRKYAGNADRYTAAQYFARYKTHYEQQFIEEYTKVRCLGLDTVHCYTDGSALDDGTAGAGIYYPFREEGHREIMRSVSGAQTNNRAELEAALAAVESDSDRSTLMVHVDSTLVWSFIIYGVWRYWLHNYEPHDNKDLLRKLAALIINRRKPIYVMKVRSHQGNECNERVDDIAKAACALSTAM
jgi:ribonuclease HI